jgi:hypothetical protein
MDDNKTNVLDTIYDASKSFYNTSAPGVDFGAVNELSEDDLRKRRNKQLAISIGVVILITAAYFLYKKFKK